MGLAFGAGAGGPKAGEERARGRRRARPLPPAQRPGRVRRDGAHGAGFLAALPAGRRPGQFRQPRRRRRRGDALHRGAAGADRAAAARRDRRRYGRLRAQLRRPHRGAQAVAGAAAVRAAQWRLAASPWVWPPRCPATTCARLRPRRWRCSRTTSCPTTSCTRCCPAPTIPAAARSSAARPRSARPTRSGRGSLKVRARWTIEDLARGQWQLVVHRAAAGHQRAEGARGDRGADQPEGQGRQEGAEQRTGAVEGHACWRCSTRCATSRARTRRCAWCSSPRAARSASRT